MLKGKAPVVHTPKPPKSKGGAKRLVLLLGDDGAILILLSGTRVLRRAFAVSPDEVEQGAFREIFRAEPSAPVLLLVDLIDQTFVQHNLPPVSSLNVTKLAKRRLERDFSADDLNSFVQMGRSAEGRKEWFYIFASVPNVPPLSKWIEKLVELPNPFVGVHLLPMELQAVIPKLEPGGGRPPKPVKGKGKAESAPRESWHIMVSHHKVGGVRQVVLRGGKLVFTRLSQMVGEDTPGVNAGNIEQEVSSTKEYLKRLGYTDQAELFVSIVVAEEVHSHLDTKRMGATLINLLTPFQFAEELGLTGAVEPHDRYGDIGCMVAVARQRKLLMPLETKYTAQIKQIVQYKVLTRAVAAIGVPLMLAYAGYNLYQSIGLGAQLEVQKQSLDQLNATLASMAEQAKNLPAEVSVINEYADIHGKLQEQLVSPLDLASRLMPAVTGSVTLSEIGLEVLELPGITGTEAPPPPPGQEQEVKPLLTLSVAMEFDGYGQDIDRFTKDANGTLETLQKNFSDYKVSYSKLPGTYSEQESLKVTIGKEEKNALPDQLIVNFKLAGPFKKTEDPNAPPAQGAPPSAPGVMP